MAEMNIYSSEGGSETLPFETGVDMTRARDTTPSGEIESDGGRGATGGSLTKLQMPTTWNEMDKDQNLTLSEDARGVQIRELRSNILSEMGAAAVRADCPIPSACGIYYYEVTIVDKGSKGHISIGFCPKETRLTRLPGWEKDSWGYHGDDGHSFSSEKEGTPFGPRFTTGDIIGCGIDFKRGKAFYTKNGIFLGYAFKDLGREIEIYPTIGLRTSGESIYVNFGQDAFKYDVDSYDSGQLENPTQTL